MGLFLKESKSILRSLQTKLIQSQIENVLLKKSHYSKCNKIRKLKGHKKVKCRTLFGDVELKSPRYFTASVKLGLKKALILYRSFFRITFLQNFIIWSLNGHLSYSMMLQWIY